MLIISDLPFIFALFALIFGSLGFIATTIPNFKQNLPNLKRESLMYIAASALLFTAFFLKNNTAFMSSADFNVASLAFAKSIRIQPEVKVSQARAVSTEPELALQLSFVKLSINSDPEKADVFVDDKLRGQTPLELTVLGATPMRYRVTASPDAETGVRYVPFQAVFEGSEDTEISVWLDRVY